MTVKSTAEFDLEQFPHFLPQEHNVKPTHYACHMTRQVMRGLAATGLFFSLLVMIVAGVMSRWNVLIWDYPVFAACLIYNTAELITVRVNKRGFHPAVSLAADLVMSIVLLAVASIELIRGEEGYATYQQFITAGGAIVLATGLMHFALFIVCCIATHKQRHASCQPRVVVYMMQPPAPAVRRKALPDPNASSSDTTSRAAMRTDDDDAIASHDDVVRGTAHAAPYSPPMSPTLTNRSSMPLTAVDAHTVSAGAGAAHAEQSHLSRAGSSATTAYLSRAASSATASTFNGPPPSYSRYEGPITPISADQLAMLPPAPPGMVYLIASSNGHEKIMTR